MSGLFKGGAQAVPASKKRFSLRQLFGAPNYHSRDSNLRVDNMSIVTHQPNLQGLQINIIKVSNGHLVTLCYPYENGDPWGQGSAPTPPDVIVVPEGENLIEAMTAAIVKAKLK